MILALVSSLSSVVVRVAGSDRQRFSRVKVRPAVGVDQADSNVNKRELRRAFPKVWAITARVRIVF